MVARVTLDAMIRRADFATQSEASSIELIEKLNIEHIFRSRRALEAPSKA